MSLICIDAGHGGHDPGAVNPNVGITEKSLTLKIAALLKAYSYLMNFIALQLD